MRAEGAIFLALAVLVLLSLLSTRRLLAGLALLAVVIAFVTATRLLGVFMDGAAPETLFKLKPEVVLLTLSIVAIVIESARRRRVLPGATVTIGTSMIPDSAAAVANIVDASHRQAFPR